MAVGDSTSGALATVKVTNIPAMATASELLAFFESVAGPVYAVEIASGHRGWRSRGFGRVQFDSLAASQRAADLAARGELPTFQRARLDVLDAFDDIVHRAADANLRISGAELFAGVLVGERRMEVLDYWENVRAEVLPEKRRLDVFLEHGGGKYRLEVMFGDILGTLGCRIGGGEVNGILLQLKYAPRIYCQISGPELNSRFTSDRFHACKEDLQFLWVRTVDFSSTNAFGRSCYVCMKVARELSALKILDCLPLSKVLGDLTMTTTASSCSSTLLAPVITCPDNCTVAYEVFFQLNSLVHMQKISSGQVNSDLFGILSGLSMDTALKILMKLHKQKATCYEPVHFVENQLTMMRRNPKALPSCKRKLEENLMSCHRVLVTPSKVYFVGPEVETSNYVVKHFSAHASDFLRVSFVEEDWSKISSDSLSKRIEHGMFPEASKTKIYHRILSILRDGMVLGSKNFEFLAFSASQLRGSSVWMFASNASVTAENIREWMGQFNGIYSVSKCAARMGQLFSSSLQILNVPLRDVQIIQDVEIVTDGIKYCFSDGIGKISLSFARQVAQKCGLSKTPSAFQIRYGGYKGVIAVDHTLFRKLSLRPSMKKFDSDNTMLNVTKWSEYQPCFLNREIICLLSTLGVDDEIFESMQLDQIRLLDQMLINREIALKSLEKMAGSEMRTVIKMLMHGCEPSSDPYLSMMLRACRDHQLSDIRSRCRIFVLKGRVLIGCLDESGTLDYGQVFLRVTMTNEELQAKDQTFFERTDQTTAVVVGKVVVTKNPCLHPGDIRVLEAVYELCLDEMGLVDCIVFPQKGKRPHPNECSGGDLDGDLYFVCWDENLIPPKTDRPLDYIGRKQRRKNHEVTLEEIQEFFLDYMINDSLGAISTTHLVYADREPSKARSPQCLELAKRHSMAVDFAKTGAPAEMPRVLRPKEYPDFMERWGKPMYISTGVLGKLYRIATKQTGSHESQIIRVEPQTTYDHDLEVDGFENFLHAAVEFKDQYTEKLSALMNYYGAEHEYEILTGDLKNRSAYLQRDRIKYGDMKDRMLISIKSLQEEVEEWFKSCCSESEYAKMASAWYHVTYHPKYWYENSFLSFPWILSDILLNIKSAKRHRQQSG